MLDIQSSHDEGEGKIYFWKEEKESKPQSSRRVRKKEEEVKSEGSEKEKIESEKEEKKDEEGKKEKEVIKVKRDEETLASVQELLMNSKTIGKHWFQLLTIKNTNISHS